MGLRDRLNDNPRIAVGVLGTVVLAAIVFIAMQVLASRRTIRSDLPDSFYTVDDGQSFFVANSANFPPFDHEGKPAVQAHVYECGGQRFVGYLERYTPEAHKAMIENRATPQHQIYGRELKKPGEKTWVKSGDDVAADRVMTVACPHGGAHAPEPVEP